MDKMSKKNRGKKISERTSKMKKDKEKKVKNKEQRKYDKGQVFVKIMAGILEIGRAHV